MGRKSTESLGRAVDRRAGRGRDRRRRRKQLAVWASLGLLAVVLGWAVVRANTGGSGEPVPVRAQDPVLGEASAPVTFVEYGDFKCPFCARFFTQTEPQLREQYIDPGQVRLVWGDWVSPAEGAGPPEAGGSSEAPPARTEAGEDAEVVGASSAVVSTHVVVLGAVALAAALGALALSEHWRWLAARATVVLGAGALLWVGVFPQLLRLMPANY